VGNLPQTVDRNAYRVAAERSLFSLSDNRESVGAFADEVAQPLVTMTCVVDKTEVVAGKDDEKVMFTVTLRDADKRPLRGSVYWQVSLGTLATKPRRSTERYRSSICRARSWGRKRHCSGLT
jgi:hypothetical protein